MSLRAILLLIFTALYMIIGHWLYTHKIAGICSGGDATTTTGGTNVPIVVDPPDDDDLTTHLGGDTNSDVGALTFNWSDAEAMTSDKFDAYKESILRNFEDDLDLEITGHYFANEAKPDDPRFENMGLVRASAIRELFKDVIPEDRILINGKLVDDIEGAETNPFEAAEFNWIPRAKVNETTIRKFDENNIRINFPFNSSDKDTNKEMDDYLPELAEYLQQSGKTALIVGHTDSTGDPLYNYDLGLQRAVKIRNLLGDLGADKSKIKVDSKGERYPIASNRTREGEHKNRRVEITLK